MCGVNPEFAHEHMAGLNFVHHVVAQAIEMGKLFHIDLNDQEFGRYDQDFRFGSENLKHAFFLVKLLEDDGYNGPRHFDAHAYRTERLRGRQGVRQGLHADVHDPQGKGEAVQRGQGDPADPGRAQGRLARTARLYKDIKPDQLLAPDFDRKAWGAKGYGYERLDQLVFDLLTGVR